MMMLVWSALDCAERGQEKALACGEAVSSYACCGCADVVVCSGLRVKCFACLRKLAISWLEERRRRLACVVCFLLYQPQHHFHHHHHRHKEDEEAPTGCLSSGPGLHSARAASLKPTTPPASSPTPSSTQDVACLNSKAGCHSSMTTSRRAPTAEDLRHYQLD